MREPDGTPRDTANCPPSPLTTDIETAAQALGIGRTLAYRLVREDRFPAPVLRLGQKRVVVPLTGLADLLDVDLDTLRQFIRAPEHTP